MGVPSLEGVLRDPGALERSLRGVPLPSLLRDAPGRAPRWCPPLPPALHEQLALLKLIHPWLDDLDPALLRHLLRASAPPGPLRPGARASLLPAAWLERLILRPPTPPPPDPPRGRKLSIAHLLPDLLLQAGTHAPGAGLWSTAAAPLPPPDTTPCPLSLELIPLSRAPWRARSPWRISGSSWGSHEIEVEAGRPGLWLFLPDPMILAPGLHWRPQPGPSPAPSLDDLAGDLEDDLDDEETWRAYAARLRRRGDPYAPLVEAGLAGQPLAPFLADRRDRGRLLGDLPRLGSLDTVAWDRGVAVTLDGRHPPLWVSGVQEETTFAFLRLSVIHLRPELFRSLILLPPIRSLRLASSTLEQLDLHRIRGLGPLVELRLEGVTVDSLAPLEAHPTLRSLELHTWWGTAQLSALAPLPELRSLALIDCPSIVELSECAALTQLTELTLERQAELSDLSPLASLHGLRSLTLDGLDAVDDLRPLAELQRLARLVLGYTTTSELAPLARLPQLASLTIRRGHRIRDLSPLAECGALCELTLDQCSRLERVPDLGELSSLRSLSLIRCRRLAALPEPSEAPHLEALTIFGCPSIRGAGVLSRLFALVSLRIGLTPITDLSHLYALPALEIVTLLDPEPAPELLASLRRAEPWSLRVEDGLWVARFDPRLPDPLPPGPERDMLDAIEAHTRAPTEPPHTAGP